MRKQSDTNPKGAGRKPLSDKKQRVVVFIKSSVIKSNGGIEKLKASISKSYEK